jgi:hypothetical protein
MSAPGSYLSCPRCNAANRDDRLDCWLCGALLRQGKDAAVGKAHEIITAQVVPPSAHRAQFTLATMLLLITLLSVCLGLFMIAPGLGILLAIASVPAFVRTGILVSTRDAMGRPTSGPRRIWLFVGSVLTTLVMGAVVLVASIGTFCGICLASGQESTIPIAGVVAAATTAGAIVLILLWIRARWQRHVQDDR